MKSCVGSHYHVGLGVRILESGSDCFLSGPGPSNLRHLDLIGTYKFSVRFFSDPDRFESIINILVKYM